MAMQKNGDHVSIMDPRRRDVNTAFCHHPAASVVSLHFIRSEFATYALPHGASAPPASHRIWTAVSAVKAQRVRDLAIAIVAN